MAAKSEFCSYKDRDQETVRIEALGKLEEYHVLKVYEFSSDRKCMSIIVRRLSDNKLFSFVKGADTAIVPALIREGEEEKAVLATMEQQAQTGLRTLLFAVKELSEGQVADIEGRKDSSIFENGLTLLGVTGIEDLLQDNVKKCIKEFKRAKCKVWMLTGDKGATARAVGITCGLIDPNKQRVVRVPDITTVSELEEEMDKLLKNEVEKEGGEKANRVSPLNTHEGGEAAPTDGPLALIISGLCISLATAGKETQ